MTAGPSFPPERSNSADIAVYGMCNWKIVISVVEKYAIAFFRESIGYSEGRHLLGTER